jgi:glycosyltransferase involved in cell wall biosynthesis
MTSAFARPLVAHIIDRLPPDGAERLLVDVLKNRSDRFNYVVLCLVEGGGVAEALETMGIPVIIFGRSCAFDLSLLFRLARWLRQHRVVVVHTHLFTADSWGRVAALMARVQGIFSTIHSVNSWKGNIYRWVDRILALLSTRVIACSGQVADELRRRDHIADKKIQTIANGIDLQRFQDVTPLDVEKAFNVPKGVLCLALVGRLHKAKGHMDLLPVMARLKAEGWDFHLLLVGEGECEAEIKASIKTLHLTPYVTLTGLRKDIPEILAAVDILVMPSRWEGLPMALLEGMAMGKAVIASPVGGIPEVINDGTNGVLVAAGDHKAWGKTLKKLMADRALRQQLGEKARLTVQRHYSAAAVARAYEALYMEVVNSQEGQSL